MRYPQKMRIFFLRAAKALIFISMQIISLRNRLKKLYVKPPQKKPRRICAKQRNNSFLSYFLKNLQSVKRRTLLSDIFIEL